MSKKSPHPHTLSALRLTEDQLALEIVDESVWMPLRTREDFASRIPSEDRLNLSDVYKQAAQPWSSRRAYDTSNRGKMNARDIAEWLVSPGVRSKRTESGILLLNMKNGKCYNLNGVAAQAWLTIEENPAGITFERITEGLNTHFTVARLELERAIRDCMAELQLVGLVREKVTGASKSYLEMSFSSLRRRFGERGQEWDQSIKEPFVERLEALEPLIDRVFPQRVDSGMDWRVKKLKDAIDIAAAKVNESLGHLCSQLRLSLTERQARRLFKEAAGISMKDYARKKRLTSAALQLCKNEEPIKVIATNAGYHTQLGFRKAFHDMFSLTPTEFRRFWSGR